MNILLLNDNEQDLRRVDQCLRESPLSPDLTSCSTGADALQVLDEADPDVVVVTHRPESTRAQAFIKQCRARGNDVPVVLLTAELDEDLIREALRWNVVDVRDMNRLSPSALKDSLQHATGHAESDSHSTPASRTDPNTGLLNQDTILHRLRGVLKQAARHDFVSSIALMEVNELQQINERNGYDAGDRVLNAIAGIVHDTVRESDFAGRYGGDRILLICPHTKLHGTYALGNRITDRIEDEITPPENGPDVTVSMGCISFDGSKQETLEQQDLDDLMERAKSTVEGARSRGECTVVGTLHQRMENR